MNKNIMIISTSLRNFSNSEILANAFATGTKLAGNQVEFVSLKEKSIQFCTGCLACQTTGQCWIKDDMNSLLERMKKADVLVFATPIYFYELSGQLKTFLDRTNPLFPVDYSFRDVYLLMTAADDEITCMERAIQGLEGWISCFEKTRLAGVIRGVNVTEANEMKKISATLQEAYEMGRTC